ncbi:hypothetical protein GF348_24150, partial [candidate division KSB3 bacterium]|nr:hypothetical protein [candidate division KSB3 bacterium]
MNTWKRWLNKVVSVIVVTSLLMTNTGSALAQLSGVSSYTERVSTSESLEDESSSQAQSAADMDHSIYLPLVMKNHAVAPPIETLIEPGLGGEISSADGKVRVVFHPEAVTQTVRVRYTPMEAPSLPPDDLGVGGPAFDVSAWTLDGTPVHDFPPLVTIVSGPPDVTIVTPTVKIYVNYTSEDVWGLDLREFFLYTRDAAGETWTRAPSAAFQDQQQLVAEVDPLSDFVPMAPLE